MTEGTDSFLQRRVGRCQVLTLVMSFLLVVAIVIGVVLIVLTNKASSKEAHIGNEKISGIPDGDCIDVAIIGAGVGGSYTAWRLRDRGLAISVFEYSDRVGGRLFSKEFPAAPGTYLEFGGMRFRQNDHRLLYQTATELGLDVVPFDLGNGVSSETLWYVRGKHLRDTEIGTRAMPYNLDDDEYKSGGAILQDLYMQNVNLSRERRPTMDEIYSLVTRDGTPLYQMSNLDFVGRYASKEALDYSYDTSGFSSSRSRMIATRRLSSLRFPGEVGTSAVYRTIAGGMNKLPRALMRNFTRTSSRHKLVQNQQLLEIERRDGGGFYLRFRETRTRDGITVPLETEMTVCAKKVVLAMQRGCVVEIDFPVFRDNKEIMRKLNSRVPIPVGRIYLAYRSLWWKTNNSDITHTKTDLYNRQTYDWQTGANNVSIIMASYHDGDNVAYWRELSKFGSPIPGSLPGANAVTDVVKKRVEQYLSRIFDYKLEDIPEAVGGGMMLWDSYPFHAGWEYLKAGYDERTIRAFVQKPSSSDDVYIVSNSWGPESYIGWAEGSMINVDEVVTMYF